MRKNLIAKYVGHFYNNLNLDVTEKSHGGNIYKVINNWSNISDALYKLNEFNFVGDSIRDIFDSGAAYQSSTQSISILNSEYSSFVTKFNLIRAKCEAIINFCENKDDVSDLYIKLPDNNLDLTDFSEILKDLDISFNKCPIFSEQIGKISFKKVEEGSSWIVLEIAGVVGVGVKVLDWIANFVKTCNDIRLQNRSIKLSDLDIMLKEMEIEDKKLENEYREKVRKAEEAKIKSICLESFYNMDLTKEPLSPEQESQLINCMKTLAELLDKGIEIYPSQDSGTEIIKLFPKQEDFKMLKDSQKLLDEPNDN